MSTLAEKAAAFAHEHGRRTIPTSEPARKFARPDPELYWGLEQGYLVGYREAIEVMLREGPSNAALAMEDAPK